MRIPLPLVLTLGYELLAELSKLKNILLQTTTTTDQSLESVVKSFINVKVELYEHYINDERKVLAFFRESTKYPPVPLFEVKVSPPRNLVESCYLKLNEDYVNQLSLKFDKGGLREYSVRLNDRYTLVFDKEMKTLFHSVYTKVEEKFKLIRPKFRWAIEKFLPKAAVEVINRPLGDSARFVVVHGESTVGAVITTVDIPDGLTNEMIDKASIIKVPIVVIMIGTVNNREAGVRFVVIDQPSQELNFKSLIEQGMFCSYDTLLLKSSGGYYSTLGQYTTAAFVEKHWNVIRTILANPQRIEWIEDSPESFLTSPQNRGDKQPSAENKADGNNNSGTCQVNPDDKSQEETASQVQNQSDAGKNNDSQTTGMGSSGCQEGEPQESSGQSGSPNQSSSGGSGSTGETPEQNQTPSVQNQSDQTDGEKAGTEGRQENKGSDGLQENPQAIAGESSTGQGNGNNGGPGRQGLQAPEAEGSGATGNPPSSQSGPDGGSDGRFETPEAPGADQKGVGDDITEQSEQAAGLSRESQADSPTGGGEFEDNVPLAEGTPAQSEGSLNPTEQFGGNFIKDARVRRESVLMLKRMLDDLTGGEDASLQWDYKKFAEKLASKRVPGFGDKKMKEKRPSMLILVDVSGSMSSVEEVVDQIAKLIQGVAKLGGPPLILVEAPNGWPNYIYLPGKDGEPLYFEHYDLEGFVSYYVWLVEEYDIRHIVIYADDDGAEIYKELMDRVLGKVDSVVQFHPYSESYLEAHYKRHGFKVVKNVNSLQRFLRELAKWIHSV